jgi:hypothetical protein
MVKGLELLVSHWSLSILRNGVGPRVRGAFDLGVAITKHELHMIMWYLRVDSLMRKKLVTI